jgi:predicted dehydrogenase
MSRTPGTTHAAPTYRRVVADSRARYVLLGAGNRADLYFTALTGEYAAAARLVAVCEPNRVRRDRCLARYADRLPGAAPPAAYDLDHVGDLLRHQGPGTVVVTTPDWTHARWVTRALDAGWRVVCEKPLAIDVDGCRAISEATRRSPAELVVTFNYRYSPRNSALRQLLAAGAVGNVTSVLFEWMLDTGHGADYFRRWHREKRFSGGLLVHKASHHFDLVNWWLDDIPVEVVARGTRRVYGPDGSASLAPEAFDLDLTSDTELEAMFGAAATAEDGYVRNRGVTEPGVDIEDNLAAVVTYERGALLSYSLNAHAPWEGYRVAVNGTEGRLELEVVERADLAPGPRVVDPSARRDQPASRDPDDPVRRPGPGSCSSGTGSPPMRSRSRTTRARTAAATSCS